MVGASDESDWERSWLSRSRQSTPVDCSRCSSLILPHSLHQKLLALVCYILLSWRKVPESGDARTEPTRSRLVSWLVIPFERPRIRTRSPQDGKKNNVIGQFTLNTFLRFNLKSISNLQTQYKHKYKRRNLSTFQKGNTLPQEYQYWHCPSAILWWKKQTIEHFSDYI